MRAPGIASKVEAAFGTTEPSFCWKAVERNTSSISHRTKILEIPDAISYIRRLKLVVIHNIITLNETAELRVVFTYDYKW